MRKSNWKRNLLIAIAMFIGVVAAICMLMVLPEAYAAWRGLTFFGTLTLVAGLIIFVAVRILKIGEE